MVEKTVDELKKMADEVKGDSTAVAGMMGMLNKTLKELSKKELRALIIATADFKLFEKLMEDNPSDNMKRTLITYGMCRYIS